MARPRVFISSTFYDLKFVRNDLELFVREMGYEPILNERGTIAYGSREKLESYAYREVELSDILVAMIGGRFGAEAAGTDYSISNAEVKRALASNRQVYVFIERSVWAEYATYRLNKSNAGVRYQHANDVRIFRFIEELLSLPRNNAIAQFESAEDIISYLREQWAGLFQRFLAEERAAGQQRAIQDISVTAETLRRLVVAIAPKGSSATEKAAVQSILFEDHPVFAALRHVLGVPYRVFFTTRAELSSWLVSAQAFDVEVESQHWDELQMAEWFRERSEEEYDLLKVSTHIFDDTGRLRLLSPEEWDSEWVRLERRVGAGLPEDVVLESRTGEPESEPDEPPRSSTADQDQED